MRFKEATKRDVVAVDSAETVGRVAGYVVDPAAQRVTALRLGKVDGKAEFVSFDDLAAFGRDVVTLPSADVLRTAADEREEGHDKRFSVLGKRVLTDAGRHVGDVEDVDFDPDDGTIRTLLTDTDEIPGTRLLGIGSYAVIVTRP